MPHSNLPGSLIDSPAAARQLRGVLLRLLYVNHNRQLHRPSSTALWSVVQRKGYEFVREDIITILQDLKQRGYVVYEQMRDAGSVRLLSIEITHRGRDVCDKYKSDPAVQVD
jgi:hypothetical protein